MPCFEAAALATYLMQQDCGLGRAHARTLAASLEYVALKLVQNTTRGRSLPRLNNVASLMPAKIPESPWLWGRTPNVQTDRCVRVVYATATYQCHRIS
jgi:hypothetical protein